jgi:hypothetical protein
VIVVYGQSARVAIVVLSVLALLAIGASLALVPTAIVLGRNLTADAFADA